MSTLSFPVHNDKENATHAGFIKGVNVKSIGAKQGFSTQPTPRKALIDVNHDFSLVGIKSNTSKDLSNKTLKVSNKVSTGVENLPNASEIKKIDSKKSPKIQRKGQKTLRSTENSSSVKTKKKIQATAPPAASNDEEYDSDSIFPKSQRLSSYVDKLLTWRPPCLFGSIPDSESESEHDDPFIDTILNVPIFTEDIIHDLTVPEFSEKDLDDLMLELPPLDFPVSDNEEQDEAIFEVTPDTSLSLGTLQMDNNLHLQMSNVHNTN